MRTSQTIFANDARVVELGHLPEPGFGAERALRRLNAAEDVRLSDALARMLRQSERQYNEMFDQAPVAYQEIGRDGRIRRVNQAACNLLRCTPEQLLGRHAWDSISAGERDVFRAAMTDRLATGVEAGPFDCEFLLEDGSRITFQIHETLIRDDAGNVTGARRSLLDLTERNLAAEAARQVQRYTTELHSKNGLLARALDNARHATLAKSQFLAGMSHELRTPLNGIIGFSEMLYDARLGPINAEQKDVLSDVLSCATHLLHLINEILDLSKVEAGKLEFCPTVCSIPALLDEVTEGIRPLVEKKKLELLRDVPAGLTAVVDPVRFRQVLFNYVSNAVKFTPQGGTVSIRIASEDGSRFRLEVEDTGVGMTPDEVARLFQEFQQVSSSKMAKQGTGLGLVLTKRLVEAQGGSVSVRSTKGIGSVFTATLPLQPAIAPVKPN